jgi:hypothetical protein
MEVRRTVLSQLSLKLGPGSRVCRLELEGIHDRAGVQRRSTDQHRDDAARPAIRDHHPRLGLEIGDRCGFSDI